VAAAAGVGHRVTVVAGDARRARVAGDPPPPGTPASYIPPTLRDRAHVLVGEVFDAGLIGEGALHVFSAARRSLLHPGAAIVPSRATLWCVPVQLDVPILPGVDTGHVAAWRASPEYETAAAALPGALGATGWRPLARPSVAFEFDFGADDLLAGPRPASAALTAVATENGTVHAVASWFDLDAGAGGMLTTDPHTAAGAAASWLAAVHWCAPTPVSRGDLVPVAASHDTYGVSFTVGGKELTLPPAAAAARAAAAAAASDLGAAVAADPRALRAAATAAAAVGARPGDWGLDAGVAGCVCGRLW